MVCGFILEMVIASPTNPIADTQALQSAITQSRSVFLPYGIYKVSKTLVLRSDSRIMGGER
jgi:hypothetical protein